MYCIGTIKQLKYGYFGIQAVFITVPLAQVYIISLGCASGNKPGLGAMETAYIPHNHTLTVYYITLNTCIPVYNIDVHFYKIM